MRQRSLSGLTFSLALLLSLALPSAGWAHKASDSFIYLDQTQSQVRIDLALRDLALLLPLDGNGDGQLNGAEVRSARADITRLVEQGLTLSNSAGRCQLVGQQWGLSRHSDGPYAAGRYQVACPDNLPPATLEYSLLFDRDPLHRSLVSITDSQDERLGVLGPDDRTLALENSGSVAGNVLQLFVTFLYEGVIHLLIGLDHILFLLVLMLPATLPLNRRQSAGGMVEKRGLKARLLELVGIVTAFTVAHSITLALAALNIVTLPIAWVETVIALSIAIAALNVVWPILGRKTWKLAFGFGLIHGFGFASVLGDLTSGVSQLAVALAGFNLGVELGQLGLLLVLFPALYLFSRFRLYERAAVPAILLAVGGLSLYWVAERAASI
ncbi:HupE/UreJ family protein [Marinobacter goseongensis]|uniref:HupE/UreJ family protein n=1 Tax=Marinobacter goseongensis TaxID=453838 RepID=UPI002003C43A|nr:HupE/UreJ family protein [Marinobacter goseongensis]MCK7552528.1 HupE/UreJ family protein [Marinobacter goseongensis]